MSTQPVIFLAFANSTDAPLNRLHEEEELVRKILHQRHVIERHFHVHPESNANLDNLRTYLREYQNQVCIFHYAGHADSEQLFLRSGEAQASGLAEMLAEQDTLKLVFLNGCSSAGQIQYLIELGVPAVIGTRAPIGDKLARDFSKHFYAALEMGATLQQAFTEAASFAKAAGKAVSVVRKMDWKQDKNKDLEEDLWTLVHDAQKPEILQYKLPGGRKVEIDTEFVPNAGLIAGIWEALQQEGVVLMTAKKIRARIKRNNILNLLPTTLSENLRHLFITTEMELPRLQQLIKCYEELIELVLVIQLAQLWNLKFTLGELSLPQETQEELKKFIYMDEKERNTFRFIPLLQKLQRTLAPYEANFVLEELADLSELLEEEEAFIQASSFFDTLRQSLTEGQLDTSEYFMNCQRAEKAFTDIITEFAYLAHVKMVTIKRIDVIKYSHTPQAVFEHEVIDRDITLEGKADLEKRSMHQFLNNQSVLLLKLDDDEKITGSLSLSPFIFDKNAFLPASDRSQIFFMHHFNAPNKTWAYQGIHDLDKKELMEVAEKPFSIIAEQLQAFTQTFLDE